MEVDGLNIAIVAARSEHFADLARIQREAIGAMASIIPAGFGERIKCAPASGEIEMEFANAIEDRNVIIMVALLKDEPVGFAMAAIEENGDDLISAPFLTIQYLVVKPEFRKRGIAENLIIKIENYARSNGIEAVELIVWENNVNAISLYEKLGFNALERRMAKLLRAEDNK